MTTSTITVTDASAVRIKHLMSEQGEGKFGLRVGVRNAGCSGMAYTIDFAEAANAGDQVIDDKGVTVVVDAEAAVFLVGAEMDYVEEKLHSGFVFNNPNEIGRCGCGESFRV